MTDESAPGVILRFRDGRTIRCTLARQFQPSEFEIEATTPDGETSRVNIHELKAVFFPKDPRRREAELEMGGVQSKLPGTAVARVEFFDGEIIRGRVQHYSVSDSGFFLYPTALESNNERVFVVASALTTVSIEG